MSKKHDKVEGPTPCLSKLLLVISLLLPLGALASPQYEQNLLSNSTTYPVPAYERKPGVAGKITSVGSDTLANLMTFWSQEFKTLYPQVGFQIQASGSSTAPPALIEGTATIGPMSRELKPSEIRDFTRTHGYPPTVLKVAMDAIAIFVDRRNPLPGMTLEQVDAVFSETQFCGSNTAITNWSQLGVNDIGYRSPIRLYGRNSV